MKTYLSLVCAAFFMGSNATAGIAIESTLVDSASSGSGSITGSFSNVSAQLGDMIVLSAATNKKGSVAPMSATQTGGTGAVGVQTVLSNDLTTYPTSWGWYQPVTATGTFDWEVRLDNTAGMTAGFALHVLRADSGQIRFVDSASWDDNDTADNGSSYSLDYVFNTNLTDGVAIETISARTDTVAKPVAYTEDYNGGDKRVIASFDGVTNSVWSSIFTVSGGTVNKQSSGALGMVFAEGVAGISTNVVIAPNDPNLVFQGSEYITRDAAGTYFQRHSDEVLGLPVAERGFNDVKAKTTTGIAMSFKTDSDTVQFDFTHEISASVQNNGSVFVAYENEVAISTNSFNNSTSNLTFTVNSTSPGTPSVFKVTLPLFAKPDFRGLELDPGKTLFPYSLPIRKKYVAIGDSITHGQKQTSTPETYAWQVAEQLDMELYNLAVGGGKVSVPTGKMLSEFPAINLITILIGYNDLHFAEKTSAQYGADLNAMIDAARLNQPAAEIFCISSTFTTNGIDDVTGEHIQDFRQQVYDAVATKQAAGDTNIHLIRGEEITDASSLAPGDMVHLSVPGAAAFANELFAQIDPVVNPPIIPQTSRTNIVMILIDDLGWMDLSIQGSQFYETPRIDQLATTGMRFTQGYAAHPRCLPSRYGLMTGRFPGASAVPADAPDLIDEEVTIGEALQPAGYETFFAGKWHISHETDLLPQNQGFDINLTGGAPGSPPSYFYPYGNQPSDETDKGGLFLDNTTPVGGMVTDRITGKSYKRTYHAGENGEYITDRLTDEALDWMDWNADKPMFLFMSHYGVHTPFEAPDALVTKYTNKLTTMDYGDLPEEIASGIGTQKMRQDHPTYAAMIESVDMNIGRLMDKVAELGIAGNTVFIFTSDNGGLSNRGGNNTRTLATANYPLRTGKGWLYEGGIREAFIVTGPGVAPMVNSNAVVTGTDIYPTILDMAGVPLRPDDHRNGVSFKAALDGSAYDRGESIFWHSPKARPYSTGDFNSSALRDGDYKLIWWYDTPGRDGEFHYELYNVKTDPGENNDLSRILPAKAADLLAQIKSWHNHEHWERPGSGVSQEPDENDVSKPPQAWLDDPTVPMSLVSGPVDLNLSWGDYLGFDYSVYSKTNLLDATWKAEIIGSTTNTATLPMIGNEGFYNVELVLQSES